MAVSAMSLCLDMAETAMPLLMRAPMKFGFRFNAVVSALVLAWACSLESTHASANDWYRWRGPEQNGVSREKSLPEKWSPEGENLLWTAKAGGMSSPIVMNGKVYTLSRIGEEEEPGTL